MAEWINAKNRLPEDDKEVLCWYEYFRYGDYNRMWRTYGIGYCYNGHWGGEVMNGTRARVIAWMPLPEPPEEEGRKMSEIKTKYYQTCDFCHKEVETNKDGLPRVRLPGYFISSSGAKTMQCIEGRICDNCAERLFHKLENFLSVREIEYGGTAIHWKEDVIND